MFKTKDNRKILVKAPIYLNDENARDIIDAKFGYGYADKMIRQRSCICAIDYETHIVHYE